MPDEAFLGPGHSRHGADGSMCSHNLLKQSFLEAQGDCLGWPVSIKNFLKGLSFVVFG